LFIQADTHTHTIASTHAYSTVMEMISGAAKAGLKGIAITDHATAMPDSPHIWHFHNIKRCVPKKYDGVEVVCGVEANIMDYEGNLDFPEKELKPLDWVVASMHMDLIKPSTVENITNSYLKLCENPYVDVIGHCASPNFMFDYEKVLKAFKEYEKLVEINENSIFHKKKFRENYVEIIKICKKYEIPVIVNSDAHICVHVGQVGESIKLLEELNFPEKLVINTDWEKVKEFIVKKRGNIFE